MIVTLVVLIVVTAPVLWLLFSRAQPLGVNRGREDFQRQLRSLLVGYETRGFLKVHCRSTGVDFMFTRVAGSGEKARISLQVPVATWSEQKEDDIRSVLASSGYELSGPKDAGGDILLEAWIDVGNIWEPWCGAKGARAAHLLLEAVGIPEAERFDFRLEGPVSPRIIRRYRESMRS
jgi:hypothetical protein